MMLYIQKSSSVSHSSSVFENPNKSTNTILVPSPNVSEDHQTKNAMALVNKNAAIHIADVKAKEELLPTAVSVITDNDRLQSLSENIQGMAKPNAAQQIADEVLMLADAFIEKETRRKKENLK